MLSRRELEGDPPVPPGPAAEILEQLGLRPPRAAVDRDVDPLDGALSARERVPAHLDRSGGDRFAVGRRQNVGVERDEAERHAGARARRAVLGKQPVGDVLEVAVPRLRADLDLLQPFDAARADVAGHDQSHRRTVHGRERLAVHPPGEQDLGAACLVERDRAAEALGRLGLGALVGADEADMGTLLQRAGRREHVCQRDAGPGRSSRRAGPPRRLTRDVPDRHQARAAVAGALQRRDHPALAERLAQRRERQLELALHEPVDAQAPRGGVDLRDRPVPPDVERVGRGQRGLGQRGGAGLDVERLVFVDDQIRPLAVATHTTTLDRVSAFSARPGPPARSRRRG